MEAFALVVFVAVYLVMIFVSKYRTWAALAGAVLFLVSGLVPIRDFFTTVDFNVIFMMTGMMLLVSYFSYSGMPLRIADELLDHSKNLMWVTIYLSLFAGIVSAFIDNVATVLMVAPVAIAVAKKQKVSPVPMVISIAVSSNLQGAATLVGDTTSIMLGAYADMNFAEFFWMNGRLGIFWAVELGALFTVPVMMIIFRKMKEPVAADEKTHVDDLFPSVMLVAVIGALIAASFLPHRPAMTNGIICMIGALVLVFHSIRKTRRFVETKMAVKEIDYQTLILLASLFIIVAGISNAGIIDAIAAWFVRVGGDNYFALYSLIVWGSVAISAFIDNIPYVSAMLPVITGIAGMMGIEPYLLYFGLLSGATLGGNLTPIGASANIAAVGMLRRHGYEVPSKTFMKISVPFTLVAVTAAYIFLWFVWA